MQFVVFFSQNSISSSDGLFATTKLGRCSVGSMPTKPRPSGRAVLGLGVSRSEHLIIRLLNDERLLSNDHKSRMATSMLDPSKGKVSLAGDAGAL